jgi:hypothetical protein
MLENIYNSGKVICHKKIINKYLFLSEIICSFVSERGREKKDIPTVLTH